MNKNLNESIILKELFAVTCIVVKWCGSLSWSSTSITVSTLYSVYGYQCLKHSTSKRTDTIPKIIIITRTVTLWATRIRPRHVDGPRRRTCRAQNTQTQRVYMKEETP